MTIRDANNEQGEKPDEAENGIKVDPEAEAIECVPPIAAGIKKEEDVIEVNNAMPLTFSHPIEAVQGEEISKEERGASSAEKTAPLLPKAKFVSAHFHKQAREDDLGIVVGPLLLGGANVSSDLYITEIKPHTPAANSPLRLHDKVYSIGGSQYQATGLDGPGANNFLQKRVGAIKIQSINVQEGDSNFDPDLVEVMVTKDQHSLDQKLGIHVGRNASNEFIVAKVPPGLFSGSLLRVGDIIVAINGIPVRGKSAEDAHHLMTGSENPAVTILAKRGSLPREESRRIVREHGFGPTNRNAKIDRCCDHCCEGCVNCVFVFEMLHGAFECCVLLGECCTMCGDCCSICSVVNLS